MNDHSDDHFNDEFNNEFNNHLDDHANDRFARRVRAESERNTAQAARGVQGVPGMPGMQGMQGVQGVQGVQGMHCVQSTEDVQAGMTVVTASAARSRGGLNERVLYAELSHAIVGAAIEVHRHLGPGKLESTYQGALDEELSLRGIAHRGQVPIAMKYKGRDVGHFFMDFVIEEKIVLELKAVDRYRAVHRAQLLSYLHATNLRLGMLINFNVPVLWKGVDRVVL